MMKRLSRGSSTGPQPPKWPGLENGTKKKFAQGVYLIGDEAASAPEIRFLPFFQTL